MDRYVCDNCGYDAGDNKSHYDRHINKKKPCSPHKIHGNTKKVVQLDLSDDIETTYIKKYPCKLCGVSFYRPDHLKRHIEQTAMHAENLEKIKSKNINNVRGNNNNIDNSINKTVINNNGMTINLTLVAPHDYTYNNIDDLTLFEQYKSISSLDSPYSELLTNLNFHPKKKEYHNIHYGSLHSGTAKVYISAKNVDEKIEIVLQNIIGTKRNMIQLIFYRFRCFLSLKGVNKIPDAIYYGHDPKKRRQQVMYNQLMRHTKMYLFNNRTTNKKTNSEDDSVEDDSIGDDLVEDIPDDDDPFWWALSKKFNWSEVSAYLTKMDKLNIDFMQDLSNIKKQIVTHIKNGKVKLSFFAKLLKRLDYFINNHENDHDESSSDAATDDK